MSFSASSFASFRSCARLPLSAVLVATALLASAPTTFAQDGAASAAPASKDLSAVKKSLEDFVHYVLIGKADLAQAAGEAALSADVTDAELATAVDEGGVGEGGLGARLNKAISRSRAMGGVSDLATKIEDRVEDGRSALSRNPQRIGEAIGMLRGTLRERMIAEERLNAAGEYAVPQSSSNPRTPRSSSRPPSASSRSSATPCSRSRWPLRTSTPRRSAR